MCHDIPMRVLSVAGSTGQAWRRYHTVIMPGAKMPPVVPYYPVRD